MKNYKAYHSFAIFAKKRVFKQELRTGSDLEPKRWAKKHFVKILD